MNGEMTASTCSMSPAAIARPLLSWSAASIAAWLQPQLGNFLNIVAMSSQREPSPSRTTAGSPFSYFA